MSPRLMLVPVVAGLLSGCAAVPNAVVAVPKSQDKPLYQIDRLDRARGSKVRWAFANDYQNQTTIRFEFDKENVFKPDSDLLCLQVNEKTLDRAKQKTKQRATGNGPSFELLAATAAGPAVCVAQLRIRNDIAPGEYHYRILQDGVEKKDPVIIIR